jgi:hypothetical protein
LLSRIVVVQICIVQLSTRLFVFWVIAYRMIR